MYWMMVIGEEKIMGPDRKKEQAATNMRPPYNYSLTAKFFFWSMDLLTGTKTTLPKVKLMEILAGIPYRSWETRQYARMTQHYRDQAVVNKSSEIMLWSREAQDTEYWHLLVVNEKMKVDGIKDPWYLVQPVPLLMVGVYAALMHVMTIFSIRRAFLFNAEFEDHAEHEYAQFIAEHSEWEHQPVNNDLMKGHLNLASWADVFRRICLDERDHMNMSFRLCDKPECVVVYDGMPPMNRT
ncbi:MAG: hypothetical protein ACYDAI_01100 [Trichloromonadaceae bacterium]